MKKLDKFCDFLEKTLLIVMWCYVTLSVCALINNLLK